MRTVSQTVSVADSEYAASSEEALYDYSYRTWSTTVKRGDLFLCSTRASMTVSKAALVTKIGARDDTNNASSNKPERNDEWTQPTCTNNDEDYGIILYTSAAATRSGVYGLGVHRFSSTCNERC